MPPKQKAAELRDKFSNYVDYWDCRNDVPVDEPNALNCALVCVEEIIEQWSYIDTYLSDLNGELNPNLKYWYQVREELLAIKSDKS